MTSPATVAITSYNTSSGAAQVAVNSPLPPVGTEIILQLNIVGDPQALEGGVDLRYTIASGDTPASVCAALSENLNSGADAPLTQPLGITAQYVTGKNYFPITNNAPNLVHATDQTPDVLSGRISSVFTISPGQAAWDAGPLLALNRLASTLPVPESNVGQIIFGGGSPATPDQTSWQWATISCYVQQDNNYQGAARIDFQLIDTQVLVASLRPGGLYIPDGQGNMINASTLLLKIKDKLGL